MQRFFQLLAEDSSLNSFAEASTIKSTKKVRHNLQSALTLMVSHLLNH